MVFLHIFGALCEKSGESKSAAAKACGLSNSTVTKWKKTQAVPESSTLMKIANHFGVSVDYLLGATPEAYLLGTEYQLNEAEKAYERETDPNKRDEIGGLIDILRDSVADQRIILSTTKKPATENGNGHDDANESKREEINRLLPLAPEWLQDQILSLLKAEESGRTYQGDDPKVT